MTPLIITHILPSKTAFGATNTKPSEAVFIPSKISEMFNLVVGQEIDAHLVPNTIQPERTPWLAVRVQIKPPAMMTPRADTTDTWELVTAKVTRIMDEGGVWTVDNLAAEIGTGNKAAVKGTLQAMYMRGDCAKFQMLWASDGGRPTMEWFTCYPEKADVDEWVEA
jgi:antitoxin component of MazEF toxin-antitoxin module